MTLISFTDGDRVVFKDGKAATENACCCCCLVVVAVPLRPGIYQDFWDNCDSGIWDTIKGRLEAAGYDVTITLGVSYDPEGNPLVAPSMQITSSCCFDCSAMESLFDENYVYDRAITGQPDGAWAEITNGDEFYTPCGPIAFGQFHLSGCCNMFCASSYSCAPQAPYTVNGNGSGLSQWLPVCNPLP